MGSHQQGASSCIKHLPQESDLGVVEFHVRHEKVHPLTRKVLDYLAISGSQLQCMEKLGYIWSTRGVGMLSLVPVRKLHSIIRSSAQKGDPNCSHSE